MTTTFDIANIKQRFGQQVVFSKIELWDFYQQTESAPNQDTFRWWIHYLRSKKVLSLLDKNTYSLQYKPSYQPQPNMVQQQLYDLVREQFPHLTICIWTTQWLNEFMLHQPNKFMTFVEVEKQAVESVFYWLQDKQIPQVFVQPQQKEIELYIAGSDNCVVVQALKTKAPLQVVEHLTVPTIEKIVVDIFADEVLFQAYQGSELAFMMNNIERKYELNTTKLLSYASRRGKKQELQDFIHYTLTLND